MNYSRAFTYVFEDKNWLSKVLIAGLISLIPIVGQFYLMGWLVEIVRRTKAGRTDILPTTHFTYFLTLGLKLFVVCLIYSIPVIILSCIIGLLNTSVENTDSSTITFLFTGMGCLGSILTFLVQIAVGLLGTYGMIKLAETDQIKSCLDFSDAFNTIKNNIGPFIIVELLMIVAQIIGSAGVIVCFIGILFTVPYSIAVSGHLCGQLWSNININTNGRPYRGTVSQIPEDVIEEAPFTKVEDIEKTAVEAAEPVHEELVQEEPVIENPETVQAEETAEVKGEDTVPETEAAAESQGTDTIDAEPKAENEEITDSEEKKSDEDIPSFE